MTQKRLRLIQVLQNSYLSLSPPKLPPLLTLPFYSAIGDGDEPNFIALDDPQSLFDVLCETFAELMEASGTALPSNCSLQEFTRGVIGEEVVQDPSSLADVFSFSLFSCRGCRFGIDGYLQEPLFSIFLVSLFPTLFHILNKAPS